MFLRAVGCETRETHQHYQTSCLSTTSGSEGLELLSALLLALQDEASDSVADPSELAAEGERAKMHLGCWRSTLRLLLRVGVQRRNTGMAQDISKIGGSQANLTYGSKTFQ